MKVNVGSYQRAGPGSSSGSCETTDETPYYSSDCRAPWPEAEGVNQIDRIVARIGVRVDPTAEPQRVLGNESLINRAVVPGTIVV
jgi:hypothetical protein